MTAAAEFAYCERISAAGNTWHIRPATGTGLHLGGGIDSDSLCGKVVAPNGWDIDVPVVPEKAVAMAHTVDHTGRQVCLDCATAAFPDEAPSEGIAG